MAKDKELRDVAIDLLQPGRFQPRQYFDPAALDELAESIRLTGIIEPIVIRSIGKGMFEILAGERRWRAAQRAGLHDVSAVIRYVDDVEAAKISFHENKHREDLNAIEEADYIARLMQEFGWTQQQTGAHLEISRSYVTNILRLRTLPDRVKELVSKRKLDTTLAREILAAPKDRQVAFALQAVENKWSRDVLIRKIRDTKKARDSASGTETTSVDMRFEDAQLTEIFGQPARVKHTGPHGKIEIDYFSLEEYEGIKELGRAGLNYRRRVH